MAKNKGGVVFEEIEPGAFYQCIQPGGFTDAVTGIHVPGPKVTLDDTTKRTVVEVSELPNPIQLPHLKEVYEFKDKDRKVREKVMAPFNRKDDYPFHEAFQMALSTGIIRKVDDEDVEDYYPEAWANRRERIVYTQEVSVTPMADLISQAEKRKLHERMDAAREDSAASRERATSASGGLVKKEGEPGAPEGSQPPGPPPPPQ